MAHCTSLQQSEPCFRAIFAAPLLFRALTSAPSALTLSHLAPARLHRAIKEAYDLGQLKLDDLWASPSCEAFWQDLVESPHPSVRTLAERVKADLHVRECSEAEAEAATATNTLQMELKPRVLDPTVLLEGGKTAKLTDLDEDYAKKVDLYRKSKKGRRTFVLE
jgi:hypothetical protein